MPRKERPPMRPFIGSIAIGGRPLVFPVGHLRAGEVVEFPIAPGTYRLTLARRSQRFAYDIDVSAEGQVQVTLAGIGRLSVASVERIPLPDTAEIQRAWQVLFGETA